MPLAIHLDKSHRDKLTMILSLEEQVLYNKLKVEVDLSEKKTINAK